MVTETTIEVSAPTPRTRSWRVRLHALYLRSDTLKGFTLLSPTLLVMGLTMCIPFGIMIVMSFWTQIGFEFDTAFSLVNYAEAVEKPMYRALLLRSLTISAICTVATVLLSYPMAYYVAFHVRKHKMAWIILMTVPFFSSYLLRIFAWKVILGYNGVINSGLKGLGLIEQPLAFLLYSPTAVVITLAHAWAAFAILPIYISLEKIDRSLIEAATDLGDGPVKRFLGITLPLSMPGVIAASLMIFIPTVGDYVTPTLVGGPDGLMIANLIQAQFGLVNNWPMGAALALDMMLVVAVISLLYIWLTRKVTENIA
ncbi:Spermidine Putrescine ABC transporter permease component PotB (TC 3.A.1.11.1) [hydrothermal vent metagenome]|uniref:Spermidine Putrescine ABC transporter permease component PotB (TC 3.A.1.11.1) n=1 Tax=hydrothermal vent metagenome TaxID=652676 RepID=A0A170PQV1_9ZZZZ